MTVLDLAGFELEVPRDVRRFETLRPDFESWLVSRGAKILEPTNEWEVLRYKAGPYTSILYRKKTGKLSYVGGIGFDMKEFVKGVPLDYMDKCSPAPAPTKTRVHGKRNARTKTKRGTVINRLIERDGTLCWFCGKPLGNDITKEHLTPRTSGGTSDLTNLVLAHYRCNQMAGHLPLEVKLDLRKHLRSQNAIATEESKA